MDDLDAFTNMLDRAGIVYKKYTVSYPGALPDVCSFFVVNLSSGADNYTEFMFDFMTKELVEVI